MADIKKEEQLVRAYDLYFEPIFRFCYFKTKDAELAKDLAQDAFLKAWAYIEKGHDIENIRALLYKIAGNSVVDWYRKRKNESLETLEEGGFDPVDNAQSIDESEEVKIVLDKLRQLSHEDQEIIVWHYVEGLPIEEIAKMLGQSKNVVSVRIHRAVVKLKNIL